jgi:hypothetical protein
MAFWARRALMGDVKDAPTATPTERRFMRESYARVLDTAKELAHILEERGSTTTARSLTSAAATDD